MALSLTQIRTAARRSRGQVARSLAEATAQARKTAFLCHSHADADLVEGVITLLRESGWNVYVDWLDASMPSTPSRTTASKIKRRIADTDWFLFLATRNSMGSRWCPWEIGYADGVKPIERILIIPTHDGSTTHGSEYLQLYRQIDMSKAGKLAAYEPNVSETGVFVERL